MGLDFQKARAYSTDRDSSDEGTTGRLVDMMRALTTKVDTLRTELRADIVQIRREAGKTREASYRCGQLIFT